MASNMHLFTLALRPAPRRLFRRSTTAIRTGATMQGRARLAGVRLRDMPKKSRDVGVRQLRHAEKVSNSLHPPLAATPPIPINTATAQEQTPTEPFFIRRTPTRNLPTYQLRKAGGNLRQTRVRKVEGDVEALRMVLERELTPAPEWIRVNPVNRHVEMKGWYKNQIDKLLFDKGF